MPTPPRVLVHGGRVVGRGGLEPADVLLVGGRVESVGAGLVPPDGCERIDARGLVVLPGLLDPQVHFREPGYEEAEDLASGTLAAVAGGVTGVLEMPNTQPPTDRPEALADKLARARGRAWCDHAFFLGATAENADRLGEWEDLPGCVGIKVFMGSSTGSLLVPDDATLERVLRSGRRRVAVHAEDEPRLRERRARLAPGSPVRVHPEVRDEACAVRATSRLLDLVERTGRPVHVLHVSTAEEVDLIAERGLGDLVTCEVTPNHLFLAAPDCYDRYGSLAQMNPPVRVARHREALRAALADGRIDCVGSDHAPHTLEAKARPYPESPSGIPGVQTVLPLLLLAVREGWLRWDDLVRVGCEAPARVWGVQGKGALRPGRDGDLVLVDPKVEGPLDPSWLRSRAGWSPYAGWPLAGWPVLTLLRGEPVYRDHAPRGPPRGRPLACPPAIRGEGA
jgi:dihydroorotase